jgi:hypothetical protein
LVYGAALSQTSTLACLDYRGVFSLLEDLQGNVNPLLRHNKQSVLDLSLNQMARKFVIKPNQNGIQDIFMLTLRGSLIRLRIREASDPYLKDAELSKAMHRIGNKGDIGRRYKNDRVQSSDSEEGIDDVRYMVCDRDVLLKGCMRGEDRVEVELWLNKN